MGGDQVDPISDVERRGLERDSREEMLYNRDRADDKEETILMDLAEIDAQMLKRAKDAAAIKKETVTLERIKLGRLKLMVEEASMELGSKYKSLTRLQDDQEKDRKKQAVLRQKLMTIKQEALDRDARLPYGHRGGKRDPEDTVPTPENELKKLKENPFHIPRLPAGNWKGWNMVFGMFLHIVQHYFCKKEELSNDLKNWEEVTQPMLKKYLVDGFIKKYKESIMELGGISERKLNDWIKAMDDKWNTIFVGHYTSERGAPNETKSYYISAYAGVIKTMEALEQAKAKDNAASRAETPKTPESTCLHKIEISWSVREVLEEMSNCIEDQFEVFLAEFQDVPVIQTTAGGASSEPAPSSTSENVIRSDSVEPGLTESDQGEESTGTPTAHLNGQDPHASVSEQGRPASNAGEYVK